MKKVSSTTTNIPVCLTSTLWIPTRSDVEVVAHASHNISKGAWLLETVSNKRCGAISTRALVNLSSKQVIVRLLNPHEEGIVVHSGAKVAELEEVDSTVVTNVEGAKTAADSPHITVANMELLHSLVEQATAPLTSSEMKELFELLVKY